MSFHGRALLQRDVIRYHGQPGEWGEVCDAAIDGCLTRYFAGESAKLNEVDARSCGSVFESAVWTALREIPVGTTSTYGEIARKIGSPNGSRAVGLANGRNPIAIVVPCHRVIGANGKLVGYGAGIERKQWLLAHESQLAGLTLRLEQPLRPDDQRCN
jgi:methylated-DNA-[protein]-cysteine S-methyltransferase